VRGGGGVFNDRFIANFWEKAIVREFLENWPVFDEVMCRVLCLVFLAHPV